MIFYCKNHTGITVEATKYSITGEGHHIVSGKKLVCSECDEPLIATEIEGDYSAVLGKFSMMSREDKKAHLKKRSKTDNKKYEEHRRTIDLEHIKKQS